MAKILSGSVQYYAWRLVSALIRRTPPRAGYAIAFAVGSIGYYAWPRGRRAMIENYRRVLVGAPPSERKRVARRSLVNYCKYLTDFIRLPSIPSAQLITQVEGQEQFESLDGVLTRGTGVVIVCMHFGNWDLGAAATAARGYPVSVVAETFSDPRLDALVSGARTRLGMKISRMEKPGPSLLRALKQNGLLALLIDRSVPGEGVRVDFFGEEVEVPAGPARLTLKSGSKVVPIAFPRIAPHRPEVATMCDFAVPMERTGDAELDIRVLTQAIMRSHERFIRQYPDQWYMFRPMWQPATGAPRE